MKSRLAGSSFDDKRRQQRKTEIQLVLIVGRGTQQRKTKPVRTGVWRGQGGREASLNRGHLSRELTRRAVSQAGFRRRRNPRQKEQQGQWL